MDTGSQGISRRAALGRFAATGATIALMAAMERGVVRAQWTAEPSGMSGVVPNHFVLDGDETHVTYDSTTFAGAPQLRYDGPYGTQTFSGDALTVEDSALGQLITVYLGAFPDQGDLWLTLLLPSFVPTSLDALPTPFATLAILKWLVSTIAGPPREGALEEYQAIELEGTAELVVS